MKLKLKAKVIVDNVADKNAEGEWGLSIYVEYGGQKFLLDTGASDLFATNAKKYGIRLEDVDYAVLSHAHYDHAGGMERFFELNKPAVFYMQESNPCYSKFLVFHKYIGVPRGIETKYPDRIKLLKGDYELCRGVYIIAHHTAGLDAAGKRERMYQKTPDGWKTDDFSHEQSLVFDTERGLVIFNSCSHGGAANIIKEVSEQLPDKKVYGIIGGFHLCNKSEREVREFACRIKESGISYLCTGHCTKDKAYRILKEELGEMAHQFHVGFEMEF